MRKIILCLFVVLILLLPYGSTNAASHRAEVQKLMYDYNAGLLKEFHDFFQRGFDPNDTYLILINRYLRMYYESQTLYFIESQELTSGEFVGEEIIQGMVSGSESIIESLKNFESSYQTGEISKADYIDILDSIIATIP